MILVLTLEDIFGLIVLGILVLGGLIYGIWALYYMIKDKLYAKRKRI